MPLSDDTHSYQSRLADYCRTNEWQAIPGVTAERAQVYRDLVFNGVANALSSAYPLSKKVLGPKDWDSLVKDFFSHSKASNPELWRFPKDLWEFARTQQYSDKLKLPFLDNLLQFEWIEIELFMMPDIVIKTEPLNYLLEQPLVLNPEHQLLNLQYPVFKTLDNLEQQRAEYMLLMYRDPVNSKVRMAELDPLTFVLIQLLQSDSLSGKALVAACQDFFNNSGQAADQLADLVLKNLQQLQNDNILIGATNELELL